MDIFLFSFSSHAPQIHDMIKESVLGNVMKYEIMGFHLKRQMSKMVSKCN